MNFHLKYKMVYPDNPKEKNPAILFLQGLTGHKESSFQYAEGLAKLGYISFLFDMRGHGETGSELDSLTGDDFLSDAQSAYDYLVSITGVDSDNISAIGTSMGSYIGILLSVKRRIKNLALRAPADYPNEVFNQPLIDHGGWNEDTAKWRKLSKEFTGSHALEALNKFDGKVLIIESEKDDMVPHETIENYLRVTPTTKYILIKDAPHGIKEGKFRDEVERVLVSWFKAL